MASRKKRQRDAPLADTFNCAICYDFMAGPIFQCKEGHITCDACFERLTQKKCPFCRDPVLLRSRVLDRVRQYIDIPCLYKCGKVLFGLDAWKLHNVSCSSKICHKCPFDGCCENVPEDSLKEHTANCRFRVVACPLSTSSHKCHARMPFGDITKHMMEHHGVRTGELRQSPFKFTLKLSAADRSNGPGWRFVLLTPDDKFCVFFRAYLQDPQNPESMFSCSLRLLTHHVDPVAYEMSIKGSNGLTTNEIATRGHLFPYDRTTGEDEICISSKLFLSKFVTQENADTHFTVITIRLI
jgi:hypothetical protein